MDSPFFTCVVAVRGPLRDRPGWAWFLCLCPKECVRGVGHLIVMYIDSPPHFLPAPLDCATEPDPRLGGENSFLEVLPASTLSLSLCDIHWGARGAWWLGRLLSGVLTDTLRWVFLDGNAWLSLDVAQSPCQALPTSDAG